MKSLLFLAAEPSLCCLMASAFIISSTPAVASAASSSFVSSPTAHQHQRVRAVNIVSDGAAANSCSSNSTHCGWICDDGTKTIEKRSEAQARMTKYLWENIMPYDVPNALTLGFDEEVLATLDKQGDDGGNDQSSVARILRERAVVDGLSDGILNQTLHYSLQAKTLYPWTDVIPRSIYMEYVVPYAVVNEPRSDHRPLLFEMLKETLEQYERPKDKDTLVKVGARANSENQTPGEQIKEVVKLINTRLWSISSRNSQPIVFVAGLTPRIYDPLSVIAYGHSSCTGLAVLLVGALRAVGIPARMAGTPAWNGDPEKGNHSWVEVYVPDDNSGTEGEWIFLEPTPGIAEGDEDTANADHLDRDPCERWFCNAERFDGSTKVYATRLDKDEAGTYYPMAWAVGDKGVPGEDRSDYYTGICGKCDH